MNKTRGWIGAVTIALLLIVFMTDWPAEAFGLLATIPWFVYLILAGIVYCGYKFVSLSREDYQADQEWIEEEGNVFIRRMEQERERRGDVVGEDSDARDPDDGELSPSEGGYVYDRTMDGE
ncbi:MAG TPA: sporulation YhaL family protein [Bacillales bacterium]|nr:sporulation YhaL family protein [Bacillales bacterium]HEU5141336.1 sporulation YhaL family protein [Bacillales bacterium]